jgi:hypothetical protein
MIRGGTWCELGRFKKIDAELMLNAMCQTPKVG